MNSFDTVMEQLGDKHQRILVHLMKQAVKLGEKNAWNEGYEQAMYDLCICMTN